MEQTPNLRILTETYRSFVHSSTTPMVSPKEPSFFGEDLRDANGIFRFDTDRGDRERDIEGDDPSSSRRIRRSFAFDEWDKDGQDDNDDDEPSSSPFRDGPFEAATATATASGTATAATSHQRRVENETLEDIDDELHRAIRRTFAFDEWDDDDDDQPAIWDRSEHPTGDRILVPGESFFAPIRVDDDDDEITNEANAASGTCSKNRFPMTVFQIPSPPSALPRTKFDLDDPEQQEHPGATTVTPSPPVRRHGNHRIQHPHPLYSYQTTTTTTTTIQQQQQRPETTRFREDAAGFWYETTMERADDRFSSSIDAGTSKTAGRHPEPVITGYEHLEEVFRKHRRSSDAVNYPPRCESVPRRASAFHRVDPGSEHHHHHRYRYPYQQHHHLRDHPSDREREQQEKEQQQRLTDDIGVLGDILFRDDDDGVFESPTTSSSSEDSLFPTVPKFIMFAKNE